MMEVTFHNREQEIKEVMDILSMKPRLITFVYGPINSGKTTLINHLIEQLPDEYVPFYVNLRGRFITGYEDFLNVLFEIDEGDVIDNVGEYAQSLLKDLKILGGIPIPLNLFEQIFEKKDKSKDMFKYIERFFGEMSKKRVPVLIIDELQVIGDLKIDGLLIYKLFNFFVRLTKELHLAHVFVVTSDSLFLEQVYSEAMLSGRCDYLLVADFDYGQTMDFLDGYGWGEHEKEIAWHYVGGKPVSLVKLVNAKVSGKKIEDVAGRMLTLRTGEIKRILKRVKELGGEIRIDDKSYAVRYSGLVDALKHFVIQNEIDVEDVDEISTAFLVGKNVLFVNPVRGIIKPQSMLDLSAIREVMRDA